MNLGFRANVSPRDAHRSRMMLVRAAPPRWIYLIGPVLASECAGACVPHCTLGPGRPNLASRDVQLHFRILLTSFLE